MDLWQERNFGPMLLKEKFSSFNSKDYIFELKFDGIRALIFVNNNNMQIRTRNNVDVTYLYPELQNIKNLVKRNTIFDGEIISLLDGKPSFNKLQERIHLKNKEKILIHSKNNPVVFVCFDILYDNKNIIDLTLFERKKILEKYNENDNFIKSKYIEERGIDLYNTVKKLNIEGIVAKKKKSIYEINKRSEDWIKIKNLHEDTFYIGGYIEKEENFVISVLLGEFKNNIFYYVGKASLGKKTKLYKEIKKQKEVNKSLFNDYNDNAIFIKPLLKCKVKYLERTKSNHLRHPVIDRNKIL